VGVSRAAADQQHDVAVRTTGARPTCRAEPEWTRDEGPSSFPAPEDRQVSPAGRIAGPSLVIFVISMDDKYMYVSCVAARRGAPVTTSPPRRSRKLVKGDRYRRDARPGVHKHKGKELSGGPQMLQLSLDGEAALRHELALQHVGQRVLPRTSRSKVRGMVQIDCDTEKGAGCRSTRTSW